ncbi:hypothetical protein G7Y89_g1037 [Cudoniella acicularis]|uniref:CHAT domain-containing protein n=1 Tax=Cudoniella acicularis TaxID=354080 RepID=A0A8H4RW18_9HELO|nr:hypothetical protein G7Y89_g1037 [Cudoniella acicularis]
MAEYLVSTMSEDRLQVLDQILDVLVANLLGEEVSNRSDDETNSDFNNTKGAEEMKLDESVELQLDLDYENPQTFFMLSTRLYQRARTAENSSIHPENLLKAAINCSSTALELSPAEDERIVILYRLVPMLKDLFDYTGDKTNLDQAIEAAKELLDLSKNDYDDKEKEEMRLAAKGELAAALDLRYLEFNENLDLEEAFHVAEEALTSIDKLSSQLANEFVARRASLLIILAQLHERFYERDRSLFEINKAITATEKAICLTPKESPNWALALSNLSRKFHNKFDQSRESSDLENAVKHARAGLDANPSIGDVRAECLSRLSAALATRYERTRDSKDINEARDAAQEAMGLSDQQGYARAARLNYLVSAYTSMYACEGELADLDQAISLARKAVGWFSKGVCQRLVSLYLLFVGLAKRFERKQDNMSLDEAADAVQDIITLTPKTEPSLARAYDAQSWLYQCRYEKSGNRSDLDNAIKVAKEAVKRTPEKDPAYASTLSNLGSRLICLYGTSEQHADQDSAIINYQEAVDRTPNEDSDKVYRTRNLAIALTNRCVRTGERDRDTALSLFVEASHNTYGLPLNRIECARGAIAILVHRKQYVIRQFHGLAAEAASLSLQQGQFEKALQQLEFSRGFLLGHMMDERDDLTALRKDPDHEDLARRYEFLRFRASGEELEGYRRAKLPGDIAGEWSEGIRGQFVSDYREALARELARDRREALKEIQDCVDKIRAVPGYERFQMAPEMDELKIQAAEGPVVVVNISAISSDAIILTLEGAKPIQLSVPALLNIPLAIRKKYTAYKMTHGRSRYHGDRPIVNADDDDTDSSSIECAWLWNVCVKPVLDKLEAMGLLSSDPAHPSRVWWVGSGVASSLPFHAAGINFGAKSTENTLSRIIPSYTTTVKALAYSRSRASMYTTKDSKDNKANSILLVTMPTTPGQRSLPGVAAESAAIQKVCKGVYRTDELQLRTAEEVVKRLEESSFAHFACHGVSDPTEPFKSYLLLQKEVNGKLVADELNMSAISKVAAERRLLLAFLSACSTAEIKASLFADEGLHLASAFQMAGFENVIGALWSANDALCARVAEEFYTDLIRNGNGEVTSRVIAQALRHAVITIRSQPNIKFSQWAPFILFGA